MGPHFRFIYEIGKKKQVFRGFQFLNLHPKKNIEKQEKKFF